MQEAGGITLGRELYAWERALLDACDLYLVGGVVRDLALGLDTATSLDEDYIAAGLGLDELTTILERFGKPNLVGKSFGVIKFTTPDGKTVDISLPRTEFSTGRGHRDFNVTFDPSLPVETDLVRRDFTLNSMAYHLGKRLLVDPLGGMQDLHARVLRVNHVDSFREDPLRILRGVQFLARFDLTAHEETLDRLTRDRVLLQTVSAERIRGELNKMLLLADRPSVGFSFMHETGVLRFVLPELEETYGVQQNEYHPDDLFTHSIKSCDEAGPTLIVRWSALLHDLGKKKMKREVNGRIVFYRHEEESAAIAAVVLERLKFPKDLTARITHLIRHHMFLITEEWSDSAVRRFIARVGHENLDCLFALREADVRSRGEADGIQNLAYTRKRVEQVLGSDAAFRREDLAVSGRDVMETLGIEGGPQVGAVLQKLLEMVIEQPDLNERERLLAIVRKMREGGG